MELIIFILIIFIGFMGYLLALSSDRKRKEKAKKLYEDLKIGKKIITIGGIYGVINKIEENTVEIKVDDNTNIKFSKNAISKVLD
ncbi:preprotein translocase subunit YajC [Pseudostreptobacillus sp.]